MDLKKNNECYTAGRSILSLHVRILLLAYVCNIRLIMHLMNGLVEERRSGTYHLLISTWQVVFGFLELCGDN